MHSRKVFYIQAFTVSIFGALAASLIIIAFPLLRIKGTFEYATVFGPWLEEGLKFLIILFLFLKIHLNIKAIPFIGVGFGSVEALRHLDLVDYASPRAFLAHLIFGLVMALFFYLATRVKDNNIRGILYALALLIPVALHVVYNIFLG